MHLARAALAAAFALGLGAAGGLALHAQERPPAPPQAPPPPQPTAPEDAASHFRELELQLTIDQARRYEHDAEHDTDVNEADRFRAKARELREKAVGIAHQAAEAAEKRAAASGEPARDLAERVHRLEEKVAALDASVAKITFRNEPR